MLIRKTGPKTSRVGDWSQLPERRQNQAGHLLDTSFHAKLTTAPGPLHRLLLCPCAFLTFCGWSFSHFSQKPS